MTEHSDDCKYRIEMGIRHHGDPIKCECICDCHGTSERFKKIQERLDDAFKNDKSHINMLSQ